MQPLALDASLLRAVLANDIKLAVGRELMVRVASVERPGRGVLSLAGILLEAEIPGDVHAGDELRLTVRELAPNRVVLAISDAHPTPDAAPVAPPSVPLPGGGRLQVAERDGGGRGASGAGAAAGQSHALSLRYDAPALGAVDLRFVLSAGALKLSVEVSPAAHQRVHEHASALELSLNSATDRPSTVTVKVRREPVEVYA